MKMKAALFLLLSILPISLKAQVLSTIPYTLDRNIMFIELPVNDGRPLRFMYDTGAGVTVLNKSSVEELEFDITGTSSIGTSGKKVEGITTANNTIRIGSESIDSLTIDLIDLDHLSGYFNGPVDGIIGVDILSRYAVLRDPVAATITLLNSDQVSPDSTWTEVPLTYVDRNHFAIDAWFETPDRQMTRIRLKVDSGSGEYIHLFPNSDWQANVRARVKRKKRGGFSVDTTMVYNLRGKVGLLKVADAEFRNVRTVFVDDAISREAVRNSDAQGLIGNGILFKFRVLYNYPKKVAYFSLIE